MIPVKKILVGLAMFFLWSLAHAQNNSKVDWEQLENAFRNTHLTEFRYQNGSLHNEAEGISNDYEIPSALFFSKIDSTDKNKAFVVSIDPLDHFRKDGIIEESQSYMYKGKQCYYRETEYIQGLYVAVENHNISLCIGFRKKAMHDQHFIERILDELNIENILNTCFKRQ